MQEHEYNEMSVGAINTISPPIKSYKPFKTQKDTVLYGEKKFLKETNLNKTKNTAKSSISVPTKIASVLMSAVAAVVFAVGNLLPSATINFYVIECLETAIMYSFEFNLVKDSNIEISLRNDFYIDKQIVEDGVIEYYIENLKPNMQYVLSATDNGVVIFKKELTTNSNQVFYSSRDERDQKYYYNESDVGDNYYPDKEGYSNSTVGL